MRCILFRILAVVLHCLWFISAGAQTTITGTVKDASTNETIPGALVSISGTSTGTSADINGRYTIQVPAQSMNRDSLAFYYAGYRKLVLPISGRTSIDAALQPETLMLQEAVVTAIGVQKEKKKLGYSATELSATDLKKSSENNLVNALNGKVAGVQVTSSSGSPGASSSIIIRGYSSIDGSNQPLFVIDGVPIDNSYRGSNLTDQANRALDLNPDDIESITVLKGGAATALYGYRAGNGVVMITTKKGKEGLSKVSYSQSLLWDKVNKLPEKQKRWSQGSDNAFVPGSQFSWGQAISGSEFSEQPKEFFETGTTMNHSLAFDGGNDQSSHHLSLGYTGQKGIIPLSDFRRFNTLLNGQHTLWKTLTIKAMANYTTSTANRPQRGSNLSGVMLGLMRAPVSYDLTNGSSDPVNDASAYMNADGSQRTFFENYDNPYWSVNKNGNYNEVNRLITAIEFVLPLHKSLTLTNRTGHDWYSDRIKEYWDRRSNEYKDLGGRIFVNDIAFRSLNNDLMLAYSNRWNDNLELTALAGHNYYDVRETGYSMDGIGFVIDNYYDISNVSAADLLVDDSYRHERSVSAYANAGLGYKGTLYLELTARNDWFSTLPVKNNSIFYPSVSTSFVFTEVMKRSEILGFGKLRLSYAEMGNGAPAPYLTSFYYNQSGQYQGQIGFQPSSYIFNPELRPERLKSLEAGTDLKLLQNRLQLDLTYYNNNTVDQILFVPVSATSGYQETVFNAGNIRNRGWEVLVQFTPVDGNGSDRLRWTSSINYTRNRNKVESLADGVSLIPLPSYGLASTQSVVAVGQPYGMLYGGAWARDAQGRILVDDAGYPIKSSERVLLANPNPDFTAGWRNDLMWHHFTLSFLWDVRMGGYMHNGTKAVMLFHGTHADTENRDTQSVVWEGVYSANGEPNQTPVLPDQNFYSRYSMQYVSEEVMEEVNWLRLRDLSLTYEFSKDVSHALRLSQLSLAIVTRNLLLFTSYTGIDPETNLSGAANSIGRDYFNSPNTRSYGFTLKATL